MTEDHIRELLREMRDDPVPADALARVRSVVAERRGFKAAPRFGWKRVAALLAAACVAVVVMRFRAEAPPQKPALPVVVQQAEPVAEPAAEPVTPAAPVRPAARRVQPAAVRQPAVTAPAGDVVIRIETPDPDIVILLVGE